MRVIGLLFALLGFVWPALADPADYNRTIAFGDSLSDNGNLFKNLGTPGSPYFNGRFSNGPTWIELLSNPAKSGNPGSSMDTFWSPPLFSGVPNTGSTNQNVNAAIGGAQTVSGFPPSVQTQINTFHAAGGTFGPNDLVSIQGGANDFFAFFGSFTPSNPPTQAQIVGTSVTIATNEASNIALAIADGAKTIIVSNLPNIGATPRSIEQGPLAQQGGLLATVTYNTTLNSATQQLAALNPKVNLVQMDWFGVSNVINANPAAFGLNPAFIGQSCLVGSPPTVNPNCDPKNPVGFAFWDSVHPTEAVHQLLARYAGLLLSTEETGKPVSALAQMGLSNRLDASDIIFRRFGAVADRAPGGLYAEIIGSTASFNGVNTATYGSTGFDYSLGGVRAGFDASSGSITFGSAIAYQTGSLSGKRLSGDVSTTQFDAYALTRFGGAFFAGIEGGVSLDDYSKLRRATGFPTVTADGGTQSTGYSFAGTAGVNYQFGSVTLTPAARIGYAALNIDGFTETAPILALQYGSQDISTGFWTARLRASTNFFGMPNATVYGEAGYEGLFATSQNYTAKLAFNTAHAVSLSDDLDARGFFIKTGIGGYIFDGVQLSGEYELSTQNGNGDIQSGRLRVTIPLHSGLSLKD
jgi:outer membrane lipase/esterase